MKGNRTYRRVLIARWRWIAVGLAVGLAVGAVFVVAVPARYTSETSLLLDVESAPGNVTAAYDGELLAQQKVQAYVPLFTGPQFAGLVVEELARRGIADEAQDVRSALGATTAGESPVIRLTATGATAEQAEDRATAAATAASALVGSLEAPDPATPSALSARVVAQASVPGPPSPGPGLVLTLGLLLGLAAGVVAALVRDAGDRSVRSAAEAEAAAGAPLLGVLHEDPRHPRHPVVLHQGARSTRAEQIRTVRTALTLGSTGPGPEVLLVTSALPGEGKTSFACDLAISAAQGGRRTLLVGADLHRPRLGDFLGIEEAVGLTSVLTGRVTSHQAVQRWAGGLIDVLPAGRVPEQPLELVGSPTMKSLLDVLRREYDLVVLDTPPLLAVSDAAVLAALADGAVLVVGRGRSAADDVAQVADLLRTTTSLRGIVVTRENRGMRPLYISDAVSATTGRSGDNPRAALDAATVAVPLSALRYRRHPEAHPIPTSETAEPVSAGVRTATDAGPSGRDSSAGSGAEAAGPGPAANQGTDASEEPVASGSEGAR